MTISLGTRDLTALLGLADLCTTTAGTRQAADVLDAVAGLVPCDVTFWNWMQSWPPVERALVSSTRGRPVWRAPLGPWLEHLDEHPIMSGRFGAVIAVSDVYSPLRLRRTWLYQEAFKPAGLRYEIGVELPRPTGERSVVVLSRGLGRDFTDRDHLVLRLLRPHLHRALHPPPNPQLPLTQRQRQILALVAEGLTDAQIARRLDVSARTVGKHLENVYATSGARGRLRAATLAGFVATPDRGLPSPVTARAAPRGAP